MPSDGDAYHELDSMWRGIRNWPQSPYIFPLFTTFSFDLFSVNEAYCKDSYHNHKASHSKMHCKLLLFDIDSANAR